MIQKQFFVNGVERNIVVNGKDTLAKVLREQLGLTGTKSVVDRTVRRLQRHIKRQTCSFMRH